MGNARRILLVDDDPAVSKTFEQVFSGKGYAVVTVASGEDALWQLGSGTFDAVFTDMVMRGMSGLEVAEEIRASQPRLPVVIITGYGSEAAQGRAAGVAEFLHKPLSPEQLADTADRVLQAAESVAALQPQTQEAVAAPAQATTSSESRLKDVVLFLLAPFIALGYVLVFPIVGLGVLAYSALETKKQIPDEAEALYPPAPVKPSLLKAIAMMLAMVLTGVVCGVLGPILGIGLVLWFGLEAWGKLGTKAMRPGQT